MDNNNAIFEIKLDQKLINIIKEKTVTIINQEIDNIELGVKIELRIQLIKDILAKYNTIFENEILKLKYQIYQNNLKNKNNL